MKKIKKNKKLKLKGIGVVSGSKANKIMEKMKVYVEEELAKILTGQKMDSKTEDLAMETAIQKAKERIIVEYGTVEEA